VTFNGDGDPAYVETDISHGSRCSGSDAAAKFRLLAVVGAQDMAEPVDRLT